MSLSGIALVTGGAGFIGSHVAQALVEQGARVRIIDNLSTGYLENIAEIGEVDFINASINDNDALKRALEGVELVFHQAAIPSVPRSINHPIETHDASVNGTFSLLLAVRDRKVGRVIYGDGEQTRDFTYISNVVDANLRAFEAREASGKVFNIANGQSVSINQVLETLKKLTGRTEVSAEFAETRPGDVRDSLADLNDA